MKKIITVLMALCMTIMIFTGCGGTDEIDSTKTQIYVSVNSTGYGDEWIKKLAKEFSDKSEKYQVFCQANVDLSDTILAGLKSKTSEFDMYLTSNMPINDLVNNGYAADITDVYNMKVDGENGPTILEKVKGYDSSNPNKNDFVRNYTKNGKMYMVAFSDSLFGFVYDHTMFVENGLLFKQPNGKLTAGKDGIEGTYDDGQPTTESEWDVMVDKIQTRGLKPFIITGTFKNEYSQPIFEAAWAQYDGIDNFNLLFSYDGEYEKHDGSKVKITPATGFKTLDMEGKVKGLEFVQKNLADPIKTHSYINGSYSHQDVHTPFLANYDVDVDECSAMLCDGVWWENESRSVFSELEESGEEDRGYGKREYRFMLLPNFSGQKSTKSIISTNDHSNIFIKAQDNEKKVQGAKEFLAYTLSDEALRLCTKMTGAIRPFNYEMSESDLSELTPFVRNVWQMYNDEKNVQVIRPILYNNETPLNYVCAINKLSTCIDNGPATINILDVLKSKHHNGSPVTVSDYISGSKIVYSEAKWAEEYAKVRLFYEGK